MTRYKYRLNNTKSSSERFGNCEVCSKYVPEVFSVTGFQEYQQHRWLDNGIMIFGQEKCVKAQQQAGTVVSQEADKYGRLITIVQV